MFDVNSLETGKSLTIVEAFAIIKPLDTRAAVEPTVTRVDFSKFFISITFFFVLFHEDQPVIIVMPISELTVMAPTQTTFVKQPEAGYREFGQIPWPLPPRIVPIARNLAPEIG